MSSPDSGREKQDPPALRGCAAGCVGAVCVYLGMGVGCAVDMYSGWGGLVGIVLGIGVFWLLREATREK
jgi:hypothetical protein